MISDTHIHREAKPTLSLWPAVWKLLRLRAVITFNSFRRANLRRKIGIIILGFLALGVVGVILFLSWGFLRLLRTPQLVQVLGDISSVIETVPVLIFTGAFIGVLFTSFGVLLQGLYLAGDMEFLLASPVPIRAVFLSKLLQAILPNFALVSLFALPVLFGLGISSGYNLLFYPLVLLHLIALSLAAAGLASLMVLLIVRIFPARRVAEVLGFLGAILSFVCSQTGNIANLEGFDGGQTSQVFETLTEVNTAWSPLAWGGRSIVDIGTGRWGAGLLYGGISLGLSLLIFGVALVVAERLYYSGWANIRSQKRKKKAPRTRTLSTRPVLFSGALQLVPSEIRAILVKDFYVMRRDLRNMSQIITPLIFGIIYAFMFLRSGPEFGEAPRQMPAFFSEVLQNITIYANVGISLFVGWMLVARLGMIGFSQEGKNYWILKSAPVTVLELLVSKFLVAFLPSLLLGSIFLIGISILQNVAGITFLFTLLVVAFTLAGDAGLNLAFGVLGARFDWDDPRRMNQGPAGCFGTLAGMAYLGLSLVLFFSPPLIASLLGLPEVAGQITGLLIGGIFSLVVGIGPLWAVRDRVDRLNEA